MPEFAKLEAYIKPSGRNFNLYRALQYVLARTVPGVFRPVVEKPTEASIKQAEKLRACRVDSSNPDSPFQTNPAVVRVLNRGDIPRECIGCYFGFDGEGHTKCQALSKVARENYYELAGPIEVDDTYKIFRQRYKLLGELIAPISVAEINEFMQTIYANGWGELNMNDMLIKSGLADEQYNWVEPEQAETQRKIQTILGMGRAKQRKGCAFPFGLFGSKRKSHSFDDIEPHEKLRDFIRILSREWPDFDIDRFYTKSNEDPVSFETSTAQGLGTAGKIFNHLIEFAQIRQIALRAFLHSDIPHQIMSTRLNIALVNSLDLALEPARMADPDHAELLTNILATNARYREINQRRNNGMRYDQEILLTNMILESDFMNLVFEEDTIKKAIVAPILMILDGIDRNIRIRLGGKTLNIDDILSNQSLIQCSLAVGDFRRFMYIPQSNHDFLINTQKLLSQILIPGSPLFQIVQQADPTLGRNLPVVMMAQQLDNPTYGCPGIFPNIGLDKIFLEKLLQMHGV